MRVFALGDRYAREQVDELRTHLELEAMQRAHAGEADVDAAARRRFGNLTVIAEELRRAAGFGFIDRARQDLGYAVRGLRRSPAFTLTVVVTLALGLGANAAIFSFLDRLFARAPDGVTSPSSIRRLAVLLHDQFNVGKLTVFPFFNYPGYEVMRDATRGLGELAAFAEPDDITIGRDDAAVHAKASWVSPNYFSLLGARIQRGRSFSPDESRIEVRAPVAILSHSLWTRAYGGDSNIVGKPIEIDRERYTVIGVAAPAFAGISVDAADVFLPLSTFPAGPERNVPWYRGGGNYLKVIARVPSSVDERALLASETFAYNHQRESAGYGTDTASAILAGPIVGARGPGEREPEVSLGTRLAGVALAVLIIACANVANLLLVRATQRRREIGVRLALGVSRARLGAQLLTESLLLALIAGAAGVGVAWWGGTTLRHALLPRVNWAGPVLDIRLLAFMVGMTLVAGVAAGMAPVMLARKYNVVDALKGGARDGTYKKSRLRSVLLVTQTALCIVLVVGAGLFVRSLGNVNAIRLGYAADSLVYVEGDYQEAISNKTGLSDKLRELGRRMTSEPGVTGVAYSAYPPMRGWTGFRISLPDRDSIPLMSNGPDRWPMMNNVSSNFFATVGTPIVAGRSFSSDDIFAIVVNENMARTFWPGESAIGKCIIFGKSGGPCDHVVVGVSGDAHRHSLIEEPNMQFFMPARLPATLILRVDPKQSVSVAARAQAEIRQLLPDPEKVTVTRMRDRFGRELRPREVGASLFAIFGVLALVVAAIGVYSVIAYSVSQRAREMGVRVALGAQTRNVVTLIVGESFRTLAIGIALGVGIALALGKLVASLLFGVTPHDPLIIAGAALTFVMVGAVASFIPAWRGASADPVIALRTD